MSAIITVSGVSKRYVIGHQRDRGDGLRHRLEAAMRAPWHWLRNRQAEKRASQEEFWALKDLSFEVQQGDAVGIIGRNGAGKSTLLKILSRITEPTEGRITLRGRVASLLEVGTGFHPELTGRENIFLNGAILGMSRAEITRKFDEIVAFSEIEKFLDTPVKRYSSGMYVRLAFAVAAHLEPEILIVDEVLAVGDSEFQKKCLGKMGEVTADGGRTVLFVSHNMAAVSALCNKAMLLRGGRVVEFGSAEAVIGKYHSAGAPNKGNSSSLASRKHRGSGKLRFQSCEISFKDREGRPVEVFHTGCDLNVSTAIECMESVPGVNIALILYDFNDSRLVDANSALRGMFVKMSTGEQKVVRFTLKNMLLRPGTYTIALWTGRAGIEEMDSVDDAAFVTVVEQPGRAAHTETFPGPYQCEFFISIDSDGRALPLNDTLVECVPGAI